jgi:hypothetical protein
MGHTLYFPCQNLSKQALSFPWQIYDLSARLAFDGQYRHYRTIVLKFKQFAGFSGDRSA